MARKDELASKLIDAVKGNPEAVKKVSDALVTGDPAQIKSVFSSVAGEDISDDDAQIIVGELGSNRHEAVANYT